MEAHQMKVLVNDEDQYSLWPTYLAAPAGWRETGTAGSKEECLAYVKEVWVDMRPRSLRRQMAKSAG
ncbi:MbtH family protein [Streptomyces sp. NPDC058092]|uniref:MbtH family protein n=1 Tax=Streptomyces sp. NPDC058092 TaxID=3346336 RepID=UPI0036E345CC